MMTVFLIGCALGFFYGAAVGAIIVIDLYERAMDGIVTTELPSLMEETIMRQTYKSYAHGVTRQRPKLTLLKNPRPINHANDISA